MAKQDELKFNNVRSVRFNLDSFALPVNTPRKKNTIYAASIANMAGLKSKLTVMPPVNNYGYEMTARWRDWTFAANSAVTGGGVRAADDRLVFSSVSGIIFPKKMFAAGDRIFLIDLKRTRLIYTVDLTGQWTPSTAIEGVLYAPEGYGKILDLGLYKNALLVVCENGLLTVDSKLNLKHLTDDSETLTANLTAVNGRVWESDWFALGYATDTQVLREVLIKTDVPIAVTVLSNRTLKTFSVKAANRVQKSKTNIRGDQFKIRLTVPDGNFTVSNLAAVVGYGTFNAVGI